MRNLIAIALLGFLFFACHTDQTAALDKHLTELSASMGAAAATDRGKAEDFIKSSEALADLVQKSDPNRYGELLLKAAGVAKTIEQYDRAIGIYAKILAQAPQHPKAATAQFMTGFIYANDLRQLDKAKAAYETFLQQYPKDELAESARMELANLGKSPEELIKQFEQQQQPQ
ncbi:MAG TPA: tetratricopeptide repeat protein [Saprospiraceae bacterium]|nr:tetratricopeptide repeat protein [Saprospiraceae bacterium]HNG89925.1 tetratricopeptide repeat protein [Saprospiraceae bacterium]